MKNLKRCLRRWETLSSRYFLYFILVLLLSSCTFRASSKKLSERAKPYLDKGMELFEKGNFEDALINFSKALSEDSTSPLIHYWIGKTYLEVGKPNLADMTFRKALGLSPSQDLREKIEREMLQLSKSEPVIEEEREEEATPEEIE